MEEKQLRKLAVISVVFMIVAVTCGWILNGCSYRTKTTSSTNTTEKSDGNSQERMQQIIAGVKTKLGTDTSFDSAIWTGSTEEIEKKLSNHYVKIKKEERSHIKIMEEYEPKKIAVLFQNTEQEAQQGNTGQEVQQGDAGLPVVSWVSDGREYFYDEDNTKHIGTVQAVTIKDYADAAANIQNISKKILEIANIGRKRAEEKKEYEIELQLNEVYAYQFYTDETYIYIDLRPLRECYDHIIVIDAGHGGKDTGSYAAFGEMTEEDYNLAIVKKLKEYFDKEENIKVFYTRLTDAKVSLESRVGLANSLGADLFLSVHCNSNDETPEANGMEVLYQNEGENVETSKKFAKVILESLIEKTGRRKRSILKGNNIYIIRNAEVPVALAEIGFLNNTGDLSYLQSEEGQNSIAEGLYQGILEMLLKLPT